MYSKATFCCPHLSYPLSGQKPSPHKVEQFVWGSEWGGLSPSEKKVRSNHWAQHTWGVHLSYCLWWAGWKNSQAEEEKHQTGAEWAFYERFFDKDKSAAWTKVISDELIVTALLRFTFSTSRAKTCVSWAAPLTKPYMCLLLKVSQADLLLRLEWCAWLCCRMMWQVRWASRRRYRIRQNSWRDFYSRGCLFDYDLLEIWQKDQK